MMMMKLFEITECYAWYNIGISIDYSRSYQSVSVELKLWKIIIRLVSLLIPIYSHTPTQENMTTLATGVPFLVGVCSRRMCTDNVCYD